MSSTPELADRKGVYRLVVAEDAYLIREGIRSALEREEEEVEDPRSTAPTSVRSCVPLAVRIRPDVVITDIRMPPTSTDEGIQAAATLRKNHSRSASS